MVFAYDVFLGKTLPSCKVQLWGQVKPGMIEGLEFGVWVGVWDLGLRAQRGFGVLGGFRVFEGKTALGLRQH